MKTERAARLRIPAVMLQGTGSDVGKSVLVAGLCRLFANRGLNVRPFKPQNMSNNAAVTEDGGEIGRAQALQAIACRTPPTIDMNPVLIKPESDTGAQLVVQGRAVGYREARQYQQDKGELLKVVLDSFERLSDGAELVIVEGAGSPAEINLRAGDIANMGFACAADVPVVLIGDIDRGGVIAAIVGTKNVLETVDAAMIRGFLINKFRGDASLFDDGVTAIEARTGWPSLGTLPWLKSARQLPAEDAVVLDRSAPRSGQVVVAVLMLSRIANFDDVDALSQEESVEVIMIPPGTPVPSDISLLIIPGTKSTIADMAFLREQGWDIDIAAHCRRGGRILGICGGFQMLGQTIDDPQGVEGRPGKVAGLGLLEVDTVLTGNKRLVSVDGVSVEDGAEFHGYEIHAGRTTPHGRPLLRLADGTLDGAVSADGRVAGCYIHGLFDHPAQRGAWLKRLGTTSDGVDQASRIDAALDSLAAHMAEAIDIDALWAIAECRRNAPNR